MKNTVTSPPCKKAEKPGVFTKFSIFSVHIDLQILQSCSDKEMHHLLHIFPTLIPCDTTRPSYFPAHAENRV
jgi:hypothetical protein